MEQCLLEPLPLTVVIGAKCSDGIVLVGDLRITYLDDRPPDLQEKITGDLSHVLMGYAGSRRAFDVFRKYVVGEASIDRDHANAYTYDNIIPKISPHIKLFNELWSEKADNPRILEIIVAVHPKSQLYYINYKGEWEIKDYKAIGSGDATANLFFPNTTYSDIPMKEFAKKAYLSIKFMEKYCTNLGVGTGNDQPSIKYLLYSENNDKPAPSKDMKEFEEYSNSSMEALERTLQGILKN